MERINVQELCTTRIRPLLPTRSKLAGARCPFVPCYDGVVHLGVVLVIFSFLHSVGSISSSCGGIRRGATAEHTIQARGQRFSCHLDAPGNQNSYAGGSGSSWSCIELKALLPTKPFFLQSTSHDGTTSFSLRKIKELEFHDILRNRQHPQDRAIFDVETKCTKDHQSLSTASFSKHILDQQKLPLQEASLPYSCNSTLTAPRMTATGALEVASAPEKVEPTDFATASFHFRVKVATGDRWLLQILEVVEEQLQAASCDGNGTQSDPVRKMTVRRLLLTRFWKPVLVIDSVVVFIGFVLAVSALSCWVRQRGAMCKSDADTALPVVRLSNPVVNGAPGSGHNRSPITGTGKGTGTGRRSYVERTAGRSEQEDGRARMGTYPRPSPRSGPGPTITGASGYFDVEDSPGEGERARKLDELTVSEEGPDRNARLPGSCEGPQENAPEVEGDLTTANRSEQTARYRAEPFCFQGLVTATGYFDESNKLGAGSFGAVYRGRLLDGRVVAIKRADRHNVMLKMVDKQCAFKAELDVMSRLHHKHLVNLVGYCDDCDEMMLVYEYMPNGTLADHLYGKRFKSRPLSSWQTRITVALQAARGIEYLHTYAEPPVIHRDIKPSNLLLDANGSVRVSDFGLCLIFPTASQDEEEDLELVNTNAAGTMGYMDPEYYRHRHLTTKSDVYSFGIVMLELLTGKRAIQRHNSPVSVVDYAVPAIEAGELSRIVDPNVRVPTGHEFAALKVMAEVASQAVRLRGKDRPSMTEIVRRLEQAVIFCRSCHSRLPVSGAQIGSSDPSDSSQPSEDGPVSAFHSDPAAASLFDKFMGSEENEEKKAIQRTTGTDAAQLGLVDVALELLRDISRNGLATHDKDNDHDAGFGRDDQHNLLGCPLARGPTARATASTAGSIHTTDSSCSSFSAHAQAAVYHMGGKTSGAEPLSSKWERLSEHHETLLREELRESWWRRSRLSKRIKFGELEVFDTVPKERSSDYSCKDGSLAASKIDISLDYYSRTVEVDVSLDQSTTMTWSTEFSNFGDSGSVEKVVHPPLVSAPPEASYGGRHPAAGPGKDQGDDSEGSVENSVADIDIESVLVEYSGERAKSITYAGFSNFSVLHNLDELMKALHCTSTGAGGRRSS